MEFNQINEEFLEELSKIYHSEPFKYFEEYYQGELRVLFLLGKSNNEYMLPSDLVKQLNMTSPRISSILNSLEKKHYIKRDFSTTDRRKVYVYITDLGKQFIHHKHLEVQSLFYEMFQQLGENDTKELVRIIEKLNNIFYNNNNIKHN